MANPITVAPEKSGAMECALAARTAANGTALRAAAMTKHRVEGDPTENQEGYEVQAGRQLP